MKLKYEGPGSYVEVAGFGRHHKDETKAYPDKAAEELLATSVRQKFQIVEAAPKKEAKTSKTK